MPLLALSPSLPLTTASPSAFPARPPEEGREPAQVRPGLWLFAPNRETRGGSSWLLESEAGDLLLDAPAFTEANLAFLQGRRDRAGHGGREGRIVLTGRDGHGACGRLQQRVGWSVIVQEQEAYLLPGVAALRPFGGELVLGEGLRLLWTPGPSPGACVLHVAQGAAAAGDGLFCGRLLVPVAPGRVAPLRTSRTFHWPRQRRSVERLRAWLPPGSPGWIASGAALGALRGGKLAEGVLEVPVEPEPGE